MKSISVYQVNKGINAAIEFKGLKAQYIWYVGGAAILLFVFYAIMYVLGIRSYICVGVTVCVGIPIIMGIYHLSGNYGEHGLTKMLAKRSVPDDVRSNSRTIFKIRTKDGKVTR